MRIPSVPESVTRAQVAALLDALGVDSKDVPVGGVLRLGPKSITIDVFARNDEGQPYIAPDRKHIAMHTVTIPIVDAYDGGDAGASSVPTTEVGQ